MMKIMRKDHDFVKASRREKQCDKVIEVKENNEMNKLNYVL